MIALQEEHRLRSATASTVYVAEDYRYCGRMIPPYSERAEPAGAGGTPALVGGVSRRTRFLVQRERGHPLLRRRGESPRRTVIASRITRPAATAGIRMTPPPTASRSPLALGERAFEIVHGAAHVAAGELDSTWFVQARSSTPITEPPDHWPDDYRALVQRRTALVESDRFIGLLVETTGVQTPLERRVLATIRSSERCRRNWLLNRLESPTRTGPRSRLATVRVAWPSMRPRIRRLPAESRRATAVHAGVDLDALVEALVESESVPVPTRPALQVHRASLKRTDWERTWAQPASRGPR